MLPRWLIGLALGLGLLLALVITAPARLLPSFLPGEQVILQGLQGTLWHGSASRAMLATSAGYLQLGHVNWHLHPLSLLVFSPVITLESSWGAQKVNAVVRSYPSGNVDIEDLDGRFDAGLLERFVPVRLLGSVELQLQRLEIRDQLPVAAEGRLVWQGGAWNSPQGPRQLGSYAMDVQTAQDGTLNGAVITLAGEVEAEGSASWLAGAYKVDITLSGPGLQDPQLTQALQLMAAPEGDHFRIRLNGKL